MYIVHNLIGNLPLPSLAFPSLPHDLFWSITPFFWSVTPACIIWRLSITLGKQAESNKWKAGHTGYLGKIVFFPRIFIMLPWAAIGCTEFVQPTGVAVHWDLLQTFALLRAWDGLQSIGKKTHKFFLEIQILPFFRFLAGSVLTSATARGQSGH